MPPLPQQGCGAPPYLCGTGWPGRRRRCRAARPGRRQRRRAPAPAGCARLGGSAAAPAPSETPPGQEQDLPSHRKGTEPRRSPFPPLPLPDAWLGCMTRWGSGHPSSSAQGTSPHKLVVGAGGPPTATRKDNGPSPLSAAFWLPPSTSLGTARAGWAPGPAPTAHPAAGRLWLRVRRGSKEDGEGKDGGARADLTSTLSGEALPSPAGSSPSSSCSVARL